MTAIAVRLVLVAVLCAASFYAWEYTPRLFNGTMMAEFGMLLGFAGVIALLGIAAMLLNAMRRFLPE